MTTKSVVEIVAEALEAYAEDFFVGECEHRDGREAAEDLLKTIDAAGLAFVPKEPTEAMLDAGKWGFDSHKSLGWVMGPVETAYRAMLKAAAEDQP